MATKSSISINYTTTAGKKGQKAITDVNPAATNEVLKNFAQSVNALTTNVYGNTNRVDKTPLPDASSLTEPTFFIIYCGEQMYDEENDTSVPLNNLTTTFSGANSEKGMSLFLLKTDTPATPQVVSKPANSTAVIFTAEGDYCAGFFNENEPKLHPELPYWAGVDMVIPAADASCLGEFVIRFPETDSFAAVTFTVTVTPDA